MIILRVLTIFSLENLLQRMTGADCIINFSDRTLVNFSRYPKY